MPVSTALSTLDFETAVWRKSSRSGNAGTNGACVEVAALSSWVGVRDSKNRAGTALAFPPACWSNFVRGLR